MTRYFIYIGCFISVNVFPLNLRFNDQSDLSTETESSFERFCSASETQKYCYNAEVLSNLPVMNGALIDHCWFLTAAHVPLALPSFYGPGAKDLLRQGVLFQGNIMVLDKEPMNHPDKDCDIALVKIKFVDLIPLERVRDPNKTDNLLFFSRTIHLGSPALGNISVKMPFPPDKQGYYCKLNSISDDKYLTNFKIQDTLNIKIKSYNGDSGSPILSSSVDGDRIADQKISVLGIASLMGGDSIGGIKINRNKINDWIDYIILSEALK